MELFTETIENKLQEQYPLGAELKNQKVIAKIFDPMGCFTWYLLNQDPEDPNYLWAIVQGFELEMGSVAKSDLEGLKRLERDLYFKEQDAQEVWNKLREGKHV